MLNRRKYRQGLEAGFFVYPFFLYLYAFLIGGAYTFGLLGAACLLTYMVLITAFDKARHTAPGDEQGKGGKWAGFLVSMPLTFIYFFAALAIFGPV